MKPAIKTGVVNNALIGYRARRVPAVREIQKDTAELIEQRQKQLCPRSKNPRPGHTHIADTIHIEQDGPDIRRVVEGDEAHQYGPLIEHGTARTAAQPHALPAAMEGMRYQNEQYGRLK